MITHPTQDAGFGIYIHWPFCAAKCPYCDFNSHVRHTSVDQPRFANAFVQELATTAALTQGRHVTSIFFGGGTPSLMQPQTLATILDAVTKYWTIDKNVEVTLEANPTSVEADRFEGYRAAGVNRVSLGVQSLRDDSLKALGRMHSVEEALAALSTARRIFSRTSFDLIYARMAQTFAEWRTELQEALLLADSHLSMYQLTIEPDTAFEALYKKGRLVVPCHDDARALYDITQELCDKAGFPAYEISNHAKLGHESRHNLVYWRYGEYIGIGPGAHGRLVSADGSRIATATEKHPETWLSLVEKNGQGFVTQDALTPEEQGDEFLLMGLRLKEGIDPLRYQALSGRKLDVTKVQELIGHGLINADQHKRLTITPYGFPVLNSVVADLAA